MAQRLTPAELVEHLNSHLETRMFVVGHSITAADVTLIAYVIEHFVRFT
jgi:glutathionyl-hydroquinone reductase